MTKDLATREDAVGAFVNRIGQAVTEFEKRIPDVILQAYKEDRTDETVRGMYAAMTVRLMQLEAVMQVNHDFLDNIGCTGITFRITEIQDEINSVLDCLEVYVAAEAP
jgi:septation ring formation regulator EzrA